MGDDRERDGSSNGTAIVVAVVVILIVVVLGLCVCGGFIFGLGGLLVRPVNVAPPMQPRAIPAPTAPVAPPSEAAKKYRALLAQLVSPNKKPITSHDGDASVTFPKDYDVEAQRHIDATLHTLRDDIEESLPFLIEGLDDDRYSMTIDWAEGDAYYNYSVGRICRDAIASQLEVYRDKIAFTGPQHWNRYNYPISKEWWAMRQGRKLSELQVEAIDWAIAQRSIDSETASIDRSSELDNLQKLRDEIAKSGEPVVPQRMLRMVTSDKR